MISYSLPLAEYHKYKALSSSKVKKADELRSMADFKRLFIDGNGPEREPTEALVIGQAFEDSVQRTSTEAEATIVAANCWGKRADTIERNVTAAIEKVEAMKAAFDRHPLAEVIRKYGIPQVTFRVNLGGVEIQCRPDYFFPNGLDNVSDPCGLDLKSCEDLRWFSEDLVKFRYHWQAHINRLVIRRALAEDVGVPESEVPPVNLHLFAVDKQEYPEAQLVELEPAHYEQAERDLIGNGYGPGLLARLVECYRTNNWPGVEAKITARAPSWMKRNQEEM